MAIKKDDLKHVAHLARIDLDQAELDLLSRQLEDIVNFIDVLKQVDVTGVTPTSHAVSANNIFRDDSPVVSLSTEEALDNAPMKKDNFFGVPKVIE